MTIERERQGRMVDSQDSSFIHGAFTRYSRKADLPRSSSSRSLPLDDDAAEQPLVPPYIILLSAGMDRDQADIISSSRIHFRAPLTTVAGGAARSLFLPPSLPFPSVTTAIRLA